MAEWSDQIAGMQRKWVEQQQKFMNDWLESMRRAGSGGPQGSWRQVADVMEEQVTSALDTQQRSLQGIIDNMKNVEGAPDEFAQAAKQMEEGIERWTEVQSKMWKVWFDTLREASTEPKTPTESMMANWEDMVKKTMSIQEQWLSGGTSSTESPDATPAPKPKKPSGARKKTKKRT